MKKITLFAIILSIFSLLLVGCSGSDGGADNSVNKESTIKADFNKPAATDNPGGKKADAPL
jgi:uncharacterized protein YcfL